LPGLCIIGDEILSGKVEELNCKFLLKQLRGIGWKTVRVSYVGDQEEDIARAVVDLSETCDAVGIDLFARPSDSTLTGRSLGFARC